MGRVLSFGTIRSLVLKSLMTRCVVCNDHPLHMYCPGFEGTSGAISMARVNSETATSGRPSLRWTLPRLEKALALSGSCCRTIWKKRSASCQRCSVAALTPGIIEHQR
jgi:hypothetical protein